MLLLVNNSLLEPSFGQQRATKSLAFWLAPVDTGRMPRETSATWVWKKMKTPFRGMEYLLEIRLHGKRKRHWVKTEKEAKAETNKRNDALTASGSKAAHLTVSQLNEAYAAFEIVKPFDRSLLEVVRLGVARLVVRNRSITMKELADQFRVKKMAFRSRKKNYAQRTVESLQSTLLKLERRFGSDLVSEITTDEITAWLNGLKLASRSVKNHKAVTHQIFEYAFKNKLVDINPVKAVDLDGDVDNDDGSGRHNVEDDQDEDGDDVDNAEYNEDDEDDGEISFITPEQLTKLLSVASDEIKPLYAIAAFAGIRWAEIARLNWKHIKAASIVVTKNNAKTRSRRVVKMKPNLIAWLEPYRKESGSLMPTSRMKKFLGKPSKKRLERLRGIAQEKAGLTPWQTNVPRHSFVTYLFSETSDEFYVARQAGNSPTMVRKHYKALVTEPEADKKYFAIMPEPPVNIVKFAT